MNKGTNATNYYSNNRSGIILPIFCLLAFMLIFAYYTLHQYFGLFYFYEKDCNYCVQEGYKLVYSESEKRYAIKDNTKNDDDIYLVQRSYGIRSLYQSIADPTLFVDSCEAKGFLKEYLISIKPDRVPDFKELPSCSTDTTATPK